MEQIKSFINEIRKKSRKLKYNKYKKVNKNLDNMATESGNSPKSIAEKINFGNKYKKK